MPITVLKMSEETSGIENLQDKVGACEKNEFKCVSLNLPVWFSF